VELYGIRTRLMQPGDDLVGMILEATGKQGLKIESRDALAIASKVVATVENRLIELRSVKPSEKAAKLARRYDLDPAFVEIVLREATTVYGGVSKVLLTFQRQVLTANAGVDHKNAPDGKVVLWPRDPFKTACEIKRQIFDRIGKQVGVLIVDSRVTPLRMGTTGFALAAAGFEPVRDCRTKKDLYGRAISMTRHALADDLASAAHLVMGESDESTPLVLMRNTGMQMSDTLDPSSLTISADKCLYSKLIMRKNVKEYL
jgi:coenzyme F420-0:L-glutamate ligase/coenzyme F420-1:gamma-L-glutamate ligase